ncbi:MAG TPA: oligosaccharide flippase family protein [Anaeromyxobacter sp.]|nr:oligosaccharide flippase family protein [Anaeromyxobacter sp.]
MSSTPDPAPPDGARSLAGRAVRGSLWAAAGAYTSFAVNFATVAALARFVPPEGFGSYALALGYNQILFALGLFPFGQAVVQSPDAPGLADTAMRMALALRGALVLLSLPAAALIAHVNGGTVALLFLGLGVNELLDGVRSSMSAVLERDLRYRALARTTMAASVASSVAAITAAALGLGAPALLLREVLLVGVILIVYVRMARRWGLPLARSFDRGHAARVWTFAKGLFWTRALEQVLARADRVLLGNALGLEALGYFHQAKYLAMLPQSALAPANMQVAIATYSKVRADRVRLGAAFDLVQYVVVRVVPLAGLALLIFPESILQVLYGARWLPAAPALRVLGLFAALSPIVESYRSFAVALERWRPLRAAVLAQAAVLVAALLLLAPRFGIVGAAWATCLAPAAGLAVLVLSVTRRFVASRHGELGPVGAATAAALLAGLILVRLPAAGGAWALLLKLAAIAAVYALVLLLVERRSLLERVAYLRARAAS